MRTHGFAVEIVEPAVPEPARLADTGTVYDYAEAVSYFKARCVARENRDAWIIAGDTVAARDDVVFGKPVDRDDAGRILSALAGTTHEVITGVTLLDARSGERQIEHEVTRVTMKPLCDQEIERYLDTGAWKGKAGAYGIQDHGDAFVTKIDGSFSNVVGFPMELIVEMFERWKQAGRRDEAKP